MMLGALVDAGVDLEVIQHGLDSLGLPDCRLELQQVKRQAFRAAKISVRHTPEHAHRHLHHITDMIGDSPLTDGAKRTGHADLHSAGRGRGQGPRHDDSQVHFHEVGAVDSIADIVGSAIGLDLLAAEQVVCSPLPTGSGWIEIAHGRCSVPAPPPPNCSAACRSPPVPWPRSLPRLREPPLR